MLDTLPAELTLALQTGEVSSFVGRSDLVATVITELRNPKVRLLTLRGTGGVGKSRVVMRIVAQIENAQLYRDGVCFVSLVDLPADGGDAALIGAIGRGLGIPNNVDKPLQRMFELLRGKQLLLVLDNCEHLAVLSGLPRLLTMLLKVAGELQVLATSRCDLEVDGEFVLEVPPLCVGDPQVDCDCAVTAPPDDDRVVREQLLPSQRRPLVHTAVQLLRDRADAVGVTITDEDLPLAERLCKLNGGIPLGIELSARTLKTVPMAVLVAQRDLQQATVGVPGGQHNQDGLSPTLRFTASYLPAELRQAWATLSVFEAGSFDLDAATALLEAMGATTYTHRALTLLDGLIGQSIVIRRPDDATGVPRYEMLPPLYEFGRLLLDGVEPASAQADERDVDDTRVRRAISADHIRARDVHASYFEKLVARCAEHWFSQAEARLLARIKADGPNVDAAITWLLAAKHQSSDAAGAFRARGQQMVINYVRSRAPIHHGNMSKARNLLRRSLINVSDAPNELHVIALALQAWLAMIQGDPIEAQQLLGHAEQVVSQLSSRASAENPAMTPWPLSHARATWLWLNCSRATDIIAAMNLYATASRQAHLGHGGDGFMVDLFRAMLAAFHLPWAEAARYAAQIRRDAEAAGAAWSISWSLWVEAVIKLRQGKPHEALELAQKALHMQESIADTWGPGWSLWLIALILVQLGQHERAAQILGGAAAAQHLSQGDVNGLPTFLNLQRTNEAIARHVLGEDTFSAEVSYWRELGLGTRKDVERIRKLAYTAVPRTEPLPGDLTSREWEVAVLIAEEGLTYKQVAEHLALSDRTIEHYMKSIKAKLHVDKRQEVIAWVRDHRGSSRGQDSVLRA